MVARWGRLACWALFVGALQGTAWGANWVESVLGDLSGNTGTPTPISFTHGANIISATTGGGDYDLVKFTIPAGHQLDTVVLTDYSGANQSFAGIETGAVWTAGLGNVDPYPLLGWSHFGAAAAGGMVGEDLLDNMAASKSMFAPPLGPGTYSLLLQEAGTAPVSYSMQFKLSIISEEIPGDFDGDGLVDGIDLSLWRDEFAFSDLADADGDFDTDGNDFLLWQQHVGVTDFASAVPEPVGGLLAIVCLGAVGGRCRGGRWRRKFAGS